MKRIYLIAIMIWNLIFGQAAEPADWANKARYAQANIDLLTTKPNVPHIVLMGNSITEFWNDIHPQFFTTNNLVCRGISGQVSSQMLARFRQDVINLHPRVVVINCGTNDIAENNGPYDEDITMDNIMSMTELAQAHGIEVVLTSVLPCDSFCWNTAVKGVVGKITHLNQRISAYAASRHVYYLDYYPAMVNTVGGMRKDFSEDGVHPSPAGYDVMETKLLKILDKILKKIINI